MTNDLDTRARAAAAALHESVRGLPVDAPAPQRPRVRIAIAAVLAVAVMAVTVALRGQGPDSTDVVTDNVGEVPRLVLDQTPAGLLPTGVADLPLPEGDGFTQRYWVYGDPDAEDPFADGDLGVVISTRPGLTFEPPEDAREVDVDGTPVWVGTSADGLERRSVSLEVSPGTVAYAASSTLSDDELVEAVADLELATGTVDELGGLGALELVAVSTTGLTGTIPFPLPAGLGHIAGYQSSDSEGATSMVVASVAGGEDAFLVGRWALGPSAHPVTIRGTEAWVGSPYGPSSTLVVWRESPTNLVAVFGGGLEEDVVLEAAGSLRSASDEEWAALLRDTGNVSIPSDALAGVTGAAEDGPSYSAYVDGDGSLCLDVETPDGSSGTCSGGDAGPLVVQVGALGDGAFVVYGHTTLGTDGAVRITADGGPVGSEAYYDDGTVFAFAVPAGEIPAEIVVLGSDGTELGRATVPAPGSATSEGTATTMSG